MKEDLENEIVSVIPDIRYVFDMITFLGKNVLTFGEFLSCYMAHMNSSGEAAKVIMRAESLEHMRQVEPIGTSDPLFERVFERELELLRKTGLPEKSRSTAP